MCKSLLLSIVVSLIGCQYQGLEDLDMYISHDLGKICTPTISLQAKTLTNNQGNGKICSVTSSMGVLAVKRSSDSVTDSFGSCQYLIPFDVDIQQSCKGRKHYITYKAKASWESSSPVDLSGVAVRIFVTDMNGKFVGSRSAALERNEKSECIVLTERQSATLGDIASSIVLVARDKKENWPSLSISDIMLIDSIPSPDKCAPLEPL